jgi:feruloyl-CoA hydratase/lyase
VTADHDQTFENVLVEVVANVAWVTLNRPTKRNAISPALSSEMLRVFRLLNGDPGVRVIVLTGAGQSFCAGMDLNFLGQLADKPAELATFSADARGWMWEGITRSPKPIIAMVNGYCFGGGFVPLIASDIAVAGSEALFGLSEINWGHFLGGAVSKLAVDTLGRRKATLCVPKTKSERIDGEARPRWRAKLWRRIAESDERPAHPFAKTDAF